MEEEEEEEPSSLKGGLAKQRTVSVNVVVVGNEENSVPEGTPEENTQTPKEDTPILSTQEVEEGRTTIGAYQKRLRNQTTRRVKTT